MRATHQTSTPGSRSRILDHILVPKSLRKRVENCKVDTQWTSSHTSPFDHRAVVLTLTPKYPQKAPYDERRIDDTQVQKQVSKLIREDQDRLRKAGNQESHPDQINPEAERAKRRRDEYNHIITNNINAENLDSEKTPGEILNTAIIQAANTVYQTQAIEAIKENQALIRHPWDRSEETRELWREKKAESSRNRKYPPSQSPP